MLKIPETTICFWSSYLRWWLGWCCISWKKYFTFRRSTASWVQLLHSSDCRHVGQGMENSCTSNNEQLHPSCEVRSHSPFSALCRCCSWPWCTPVSILGGSRERLLVSPGEVGALGKFGVYFQRSGELPHHCKSLLVIYTGQSTAVG